MLPEVGDVCYLTLSTKVNDKECFHKKAEVTVIVNVNSTECYTTLYGCDTNAVAVVEFVLHTLITGVAAVAGARFLGLVKVLQAAAAAAELETGRSAVG